MLPATTSAPSPAAALVGLLLPLGGCVTARPLVLPDGRQGAAIRCNGGLNSIEERYQRAGELCPRGYDVYGGSTEERPFIVANQSTLIGGSSRRRAIMVACKG